MSRMARQRMRQLTPAVRIGRFLQPWIRRLVLWLFALWCLFPIYWLFTMSLKRQVDAISRKPKFIFQPIWDNYVTVLGSGEVWLYFQNSLIVALGTTALSWCSGCPPHTCWRATGSPGTPISASGS